MRSAWSFGLLLTICGSVFACSRQAQEDPAAVVERFINDARNGDRDAIYATLGPKTRARLEQRRASAKRVSGRLALAPQDFLSVGQAPPAWETSGVRTLSVSGQRAVVQVNSATGDRHDLVLVREGQTWKIELPGV